MLYTTATITGPVEITTRMTFGGSDKEKKKKNRKRTPPSPPGEGVANFPLATPVGVTPKNQTHWETGLRLWAVATREGVPIFLCLPCPQLC